MPFMKIPGVTGQVYVPEKIPGKQAKHHCPDCFTCQFCSDDRCNVCRSQESNCHNGKNCRQKPRGAGTAPTLNTTSQRYHNRQQ